MCLLFKSIVVYVNELTIKMNNCSKVYSLEMKMESHKTVYKLACAALVCVFTSACLSSSEAKG